MNDDLEALDQLIDEAVDKEKSLAIRADELALQSKQFADYLAEPFLFHDGDVKVSGDLKLLPLYMASCL